MNKTGLFLADIICTVMSILFAVNFLITGADTALILAFLFWILSESYRIRMEVRGG